MESGFPSVFSYVPSILATMYVEDRPDIQLTWPIQL